MIGNIAVGTSLVVTQGIHHVELTVRSCDKSYGTGVDIGTGESIWVGFIGLPA